MAPAAPAPSSDAKRLLAAIQAQSEAQRLLEATQVQLAAARNECEMLRSEKRQSEAAHQEVRARLERELGGARSQLAALRSAVAAVQAPLAGAVRSLDAAATL